MSWISYMAMFAIAFFVGVVAESGKKDLWIGAGLLLCLSFLQAVFWQIEHSWPGILAPDFIMEMCKFFLVMIAFIFLGWGGAKYLARRMPTDGGARG